MGDILVSTGRLSTQDALRILHQQKVSKKPFGEIAIALKVLTRADVDYALSLQFDYAYLSDKESDLSPALIAAYQPFSRVGENLRALRSQLMLRWFNADPHNKLLALVSPGTGEGRSFIAANLAIVFAQQGERTLLIDADMRSDPANGQGALFKLRGGVGLSGILAGRTTIEAAQAVPGLARLVVLPAGAQPPNPQELLGRVSFAQLLFEASQNFDVILIDTPSGTKYSDAEIIAARAGAAMMVTRKDKSQLSDAALLSQRLQDQGVLLLGAVLNDA
ncbi:chain length determinant protein tyrosine kinase EpsG [Curvibacter sp. APW13]|uniref:chain length determinant protein tyrosine kinase EpsG n=1 Tax=Curvibacter sp. APW13 TaxID=3077236 RepID=UPI0028DEAF5D|nr:chain length determinant protein tyrosine kinase EpsG [Curvibacter sp. APW13]MDT8992589.1 chain length determinant protein tyrosine kinase EpsG [Curvibacter sp. APW13]